MEGLEQGGGAAPDEPQTHPPMVQLPNISYCILNPPSCRKTILLGFQHFLVMLGTIVIIPTALVPHMGGGNEEKAKVIQTLFFVAGINTSLQTLFGTRLQTVIGGSCTFVPTTVSIILASRFSGEPDPIEVAKCVEIGLPELVLLVFVSQCLSHVMGSRRVLGLGKHIFHRFAFIFTVGIVWIYAHILTAEGAYNNVAPLSQIYCSTDGSGLIDATPWIRVPYPFQWGAPSFHVGEVFAMMMETFVALVESSGAFIAVRKYASATSLPPSILSRGIGWQGVGIMLSRLFATVIGPSVSVENAGLLALTRVGSRRVVQISAGFFIFFSILGKFGVVFASIPFPIVAVLYCLFFAYIGAGGVSFLQFCNLTNFRTKFILSWYFCNKL